MKIKLVYLVSDITNNYSLFDASPVLMLNGINRRYYLTYIANWHNSVNRSFRLCFAETLLRDTPSGCVLKADSSGAVSRSLRRQERELNSKGMTNSVARLRLKGVIV